MHPEITNTSGHHRANTHGRCQAIATSEREIHLKNMVGGFCKGQVAKLKSWGATCHQKLLQNQVSQLKILYMCVCVCVCVCVYVLFVCRNRSAD